jgi:hypothetical protein
MPLQVRSVFVSKITSFDWSHWHLVNYCNLDRNLTVTLQLTFIIAFNLLTTEFYI